MQQGSTGSPISTRLREAHGELTRRGNQESKGKGEELHRAKNSRETELTMASNSLS